MTLIPRTTGIALAILVLAACGSTTPGTQTDPSPTSGASSSTPVLVSSATGVPSPGTGDRSPAIVVKGVIEAGVEAGCTILRAPDGSAHSLAGGTDALVPGQEVELRGHLDPAHLGICQQGPVFVVTEIVTS